MNTWTLKPSPRAVWLALPLLLAALIPARAAHQPTPLEQAAYRLTQASQHWYGVTHYSYRYGPQAELARALAATTRTFYEQTRYRHPPDRLWASWEILAARFHQMRELYWRHFQGHRYGQRYGHGPGHRYPGHGPGYGRGHSGSYGYTVYGQGRGPLIAWENLATAFYELHQAVRYLRDRYYGPSKHSSSRYGYRDYGYADRRRHSYGHSGGH